MTKIAQAIMQKTDNRVAQLQVVVEGTTITLSGTVSTYYIRQLAQTAAKRHCNSHELIDNINVSSSSHHRATASVASSTLV